MRKKVGFGKKSKSSVTDTRCISDYFYLIIHAFGKKSKATVKIRGKNDYWAGPSFIWKIVGKKKSRKWWWIIELGPQSYESKKT